MCKSAKCCSPRTALVIWIVYAIVGIILGLVICAVFNVAFDNRLVPAQSDSMVACCLYCVQYRPAAFLGLASSLFAAICLIQVIYLYVRGEVQQLPPHPPVLCLFGVKGAIGMSLGLGAFVAFLGLGIIDSINHVGEFTSETSMAAVHPQCKSEPLGFKTYIHPV